MLLLPPIDVTWNEAVSGILGSVSLASWIFLLVPQLLENYRHSSAEGVSITFLCIWALGDVTNLIGAVWAGLVPTVVALAVYFCFSDTILILQCTWYNAKNARKAKERQSHQSDISGEQSPLLGDRSQQPIDKRKRSLTDITEDNLGLPGSRRKSSGQHGDSQSSESLLGLVLEEPTGSRAWFKNSISILAIVLLGTAGWAIAWRSGFWRPSPVDDHNDGTIPIGAEVLGYFSAVCYLGARIPQIIHNQRSKSCEGLSLLFFLLSLMGNATYGAGILFHSLEQKYFITNLPWLIGSLGTMVEDGIIFIQFHAFGENPVLDGTAIEDGE